MLDKHLPTAQSNTTSPAVGRFSVGFYVYVCALYVCICTMCVQKPEELQNWIVWNWIHRLLWADMWNLDLLKSSKCSQPLSQSLDPSVLICRFPWNCQCKLNSELTDGGLDVTQYTAHVFSHAVEPHTTPLCFFCLKLPEKKKKSC